MATNEIRFRRPKDHEILMQTLREDGKFSTLRDVMLFAAAVGYHQGRRESFQSAGEPVRYETMMDPTWAGPLMEMLAAAAYPEDPEILSPSRRQDQVTVFEEFVNGGLNYLQGELNVRKEPADVLCASLVIDALSDAVGKDLSMKDLVDELTWGS